MYGQFRKCGILFFFSLCSGQFRGQKSLGPHEIISLENGKLSGFPAKKKNNITNFLNRPYIGSFMSLQYLIINYIL
jgi:hypothetical protein